MIRRLSGAVRWDRHPAMGPLGRLLRDALRVKGWKAPRMLYLEADGAVHDEEARGERAGDVLRFLFPSRPVLSRLLGLTKGDHP